MFDKFCDDWIRTADLWNQKWPLYQLSHNHCPNAYLMQLFCFRVNWVSFDVSSGIEAVDLVVFFPLNFPRLVGKLVLLPVGATN